MENTYKQEIGKILEAEIKYKGISLLSLQKKLKITYNQLQGVLKGNTDYRISSLLKLLNERGYKLTITKK